MSENIDTYNVLVIDQPNSKYVDTARHGGHYTYNHISWDFPGSNERIQSFLRETGR
jgi:hypothetical protein